MAYSVCHVLSNFKIRERHRSVTIAIMELQTGVLRQNVITVTSLIHQYDVFSCFTVIYL